MTFFYFLFECFKQKEHTVCTNAEYRLIRDPSYVVELRLNVKASRKDCSGYITVCTAYNSFSAPAPVPKWAVPDPEMPVTTSHIFLSQTSLRSEVC